MNSQEKPSSAARRFCNRAGARTFLSAATRERSQPLKISPTLHQLHFAADKDVRAPVPSGETSPAPAHAK